MKNFFHGTAVLLSAVLCVSLFSSCGKTSYLQSSSADGTFSTRTDEDTYVSDEADSSNETENVSTGKTESGEESSEGRSAEAAEPAMIFVEAAGAVAAPGVYRVPAGSRAFEVIALAGGLLPEADTSEINQAAEVADGTKLYIRRQGEAVSEAAVLQPAGGSSASSSPESSSSGGLVNINTADAATLMTLPGIGQSKADAIISYREEKGPFKKTSDLKKISGIKDGLFSKISDKITV